MSDIDRWATNAAGNNMSPPNGWPEGMSPAMVNDAAREMMAAIRRWFNDAEWIQHRGGGAHTISRSTTNIFEVEGIDATGEYMAERRVRVIGVATGTIYGKIATSTFSVNTKVTVAFDDAADEMVNESLSVYLGAVRYPNKSVPITDTDFSSISGSYASYITVRADSLSASEAHFFTVDANSLCASTAAITWLNVTQATGTSLSFNEVRALSMDATSLSASELDAVNASLVNVYSTFVNAISLSTSELRANEATLVNIYSSFVNAQKVNTTSLSTSELRAQNASMVNIYATFINATSLSCSEASFESLSASNLSAENTSFTSMSAINGNIATCNITQLRGSSVSFSAARFDSMSASIAHFLAASATSLSVVSAFFDGARGTSLSFASGYILSLSTYSGFSYRFNTGSLSASRASIFSLGVGSLSASNARILSCSASYVRWSRAYGQNATIDSLSGSNVNIYSLSAQNYAQYPTWHRLYLTSGKVIANGALTRLVFNAQEGGATITNSASHITAPTGAKWFCATAGTWWGSGTGGIRFSEITKNGSGIARNRIPGNGEDETTVCSGPTSCTAGDTIEFQVLQSRGSSLTFQANSWTYLSVVFYFQ